MNAIATLLDVNVWLARALPLHQFHSKALDWFDSQEASGSALFCRATQNSFLHLLTTNRLMAEYESNPYSNPNAWAFYSHLLADHLVDYAQEPAEVEAIWKSLATYAAPSPKVWMDSYLAAFAIAGNYSFLTTDGGFRQFKDLDLVLIS